MKPRYQNQKHQGSSGFTLVELASVLAVLVLFTLLALPALAGNSSTATGITCLDNLRRLNLAWQLYAAESGGKLVNNFSIGDTMGTVSDQTYLTWTHNIMDWSTNPSNTNVTHAAASKLFPHLQGGVSAFKCPADRFKSAQQTQAGWTIGRLRSYSMNGFMGPFSRNTSDSTYKGINPFTPGHRQFVLDSSIPRPESTMVFLDEHPDSINDGYFINVPNSTQWYDLPASYHNGAAGVSFADGRAEFKTWINANTKQPVRYGFLNAGPISPSQRQDHQWLTERMSVLHQTLGIRKLNNNQARIIWSPESSTYRLESSSTLDPSEWNTAPETIVRASGQASLTASADGEGLFFRLVRP